MTTTFAGGSCNNPAIGGLRGTLVAGLLATAALGGATTARAQDIELSSLDGTNGFRMLGFDSFALAGASVSGAGDVNGDGIDDFLVGAPYADAPTGSEAGQVYLVFGRSTPYPASWSLSQLNAPGQPQGVRFDGSGAVFRMGTSVSGAGDVNLDGFADILLGAPRGNRAYLVYGQSGALPTTFAMSNLTESSNPRGCVMGSIDPEDRFGNAVSGAGDVNGDGFSDLLIGAYYTSDPAPRRGAAFLVLGQATRFPSTLLMTGLGISTNPLGRLFRSNEYDDRLGASVSGAGDNNGDGFDDIILGSSYHNQPLNVSGRAVVIFGQTGISFGGGGNFEVSSLTTSSNPRGYRVGIDLKEAEMGASVGSAGDTNGDGLADLVVGAPGASFAYPSVPGSSFLIFGQTTLPTSYLTSDLNAGGFPAGLQLAGATDARPGDANSSAGDLDGDGLLDFVIGDPGNDEVTFDGGRGYRLFGTTAAPTGSLALTDLGASSSPVGGGFVPDLDFGSLGSSIRHGGDINGDGVADVVIGAALADPIYADEGAAYVVFSGPPATSGTYRTFAAAGDAARRPVGSTGTGSSRTPESRATVDFSAGSAASNIVVELTRNDTGITGFALADVANVRWTISTDRSGSGSTRVTLRFTNAEVAGIPEANLAIYSSTSLSGPWTQATLNIVRQGANEVIGTVAGITSTPQHFILVNSGVVQPTPTPEATPTATPTPTVTPTPTASPTASPTPTPTPPNSWTIDVDGDGYSDLYEFNRGSSHTSNASRPNPLLGDTNSDNAVNNADVTFLSNAIANGTAASLGTQRAGIVDDNAINIITDDTVYNAADVTQLGNFLNGTVTILR